MQRKNKLSALCFFCCITFMFLSCNNTNNWLTDYNQAVKLADKQNKNIFLFLSAEDYNQPGSDLRTAIFETETFKNEAEKDYVLVQLDFSYSKYEAAEPKEGATEEEKAAAEVAMAKLEADSQLVMGLNVNTFPTIMLMTPEGYVFGTIYYNPEVTTPEQFLEYLNGYKPTMENINDLVKSVKSSKGIKKAKAIDNLYNALPETHRYLLSDLTKQVPELDPENETGVIGRYLLEAAYSEAFQLLQMGSYEDAIQVLQVPLESGFLNNEEMQEVYYQIAFFYSRLGETYNTQVLDYLTKSYDAAPDSQVAVDIVKPTLDMYKNQKEQVAE